MAGVAALHLLLVSGWFWARSGSTRFHFVSQPRTYADAKSYCRETFSDLATLHNSSDMKTIMSISSPQGRAWIGLELGSTRTWYWSEADHVVDFVNWRPGEPQNSTEDRCAVMDPQGLWFESDCSTRRSFVCHGGAAPLFVASKMTWRKAQTHCRNLTLDLASLHSAAQNQALRNISQGQNIWTGLFQEAWTWSDGSPSAFRFWKPNQPNYLADQECVATVLKNDGRWNDLRCSLTLRFFCQGPRKVVSTTRSTLGTTHLTLGMTRLTSGMTRLTSGTTRLTLGTTHLTLGMTRLTSGTTHLTPGTTRLTSGTTHLTSGTRRLTSSSPEDPTTDPHFRAGTARSTDPPRPVVTTTSSPHVTSTNSVNTRGAPETSDSTQGSHTVTSNRRPSSPGGYILIHQNLTWAEALSYCRDHHGDLADVTSLEAQVRAAEAATRATTTHAWLGLRYTCGFGFWFWTSSASLCYDHWGPGQGADPGCGVTGAMEATGGQHWVGLPETSRLNFICRVCK